jgi:AcrR family transcriptional regulator
MDMNTRSYSMTVRAAAADETRRAILTATFALVGEKSSVEIVLSEVADRAGVTVKTILRHFGSRGGLFDAVMLFAAAEVEDERVAPVGDIARAVGIVVDHYEARGDWVIRMLAQEHSDPRVHVAMERGRAVHRAWVETTFAPQLGNPRPNADATVDLLVVALDVYTWKLLRRDRGLDRDETELRMEALARAVVGDKGA